MRFTRTPLTGNQVLIEGTDVRGTMDSQVVDSSQWEEIKQHSNFHQAIAKVDEAIETMLAPIQKAVDEANAAAQRPAPDPLLYFVEQEEVEGVVPQRPIIARLNSDSVILRAIESGAEDRLLWVNHELVLTAAPVQLPPPPYTDDIF